jgi:hypothetical protein
MVHYIKLEPRIHILNLERATYGEILIFYMEEVTEGEILILILGGINERHVVQSGIWVPTMHLL